MYRIDDILDKINNVNTPKARSLSVSESQITLADIMLCSFVEVKDLAGDNLSWGESNYLYQQAQTALKENKLLESRILSLANPQLTKAVTAVWAARSEVEADYKTVRYSGKERDATGLYYYGYRYYQPWVGRWLSADPAGTVDGLNLYRMVRNNPLLYVDLEGCAPVKPGINIVDELLPAISINRIIEIKPIAPRYAEWMLNQLSNFGGEGGGDLSNDGKEKPVLEFDNFYNYLSDNEKKSEQATHYDKKYAGRMRPLSSSMNAGAESHLTFIADSLNRSMAELNRDPSGQSVLASYQAKLQEYTFFRHAGTKTTKAYKDIGARIMQHFR